MNCPRCGTKLRDIDRVGSEEMSYICPKSGVVWCLNIFTGVWTKISTDKKCEKRL